MEHFSSGEYMPNLLISHFAIVKTNNSSYNSSVSRISQGRQVRLLGRLDSSRE